MERLSESEVSSQGLRDELTLGKERIAGLERSHEEDLSSLRARMELSSKKDQEARTDADLRHRRELETLREELTPSDTGSVEEDRLRGEVDRLQAQVSTAQQEAETQKVSRVEAETQVKRLLSELAAQSSPDG